MKRSTGASGPDWIRDFVRAGASRSFYMPAPPGGGPGGLSEHTIATRHRSRTVVTVGNVRFEGTSHEVTFGKQRHMMAQN